MKKVDIVKQHCSARTSSFLNKQALATKKRNVVKTQKTIQSLRLSIDRAMNRDTRLSSLSDSCLQRMRDDLEKERHSTNVIEYGREARLHNGAKELLNLIDTYCKSKKPKGPAQYSFRKAIQVAGPKFNAQHGGMDLSHGHGMLMLEQWLKICQIMNRTYEGVSEFRH